MTIIKFDTNASFGMYMSKKISLASLCLFCMRVSMSVMTYLNLELVKE
jgi:hypothetical protein